VSKVYQKSATKTAVFAQHKKPLVERLFGQHIYACLFGLLPHPTAPLGYFSLMGKVVGEGYLNFRFSFSFDRQRKLEPGDGSNELPAGSPLFPSEKKKKRR